MILSFKDSSKVENLNHLQHSRITVNNCPLELGECSNENCQNYIKPYSYTHDERCVYEFGECPSPECSNYQPSRRISDIWLKDYQFDVIDNGYNIVIWDKKRYVGTSPLGKNCRVAEIILNDNR
jgi:hypothetical protein